MMLPCLIKSWITVIININCECPFNSKGQGIIAIVSLNANSGIPFCV